MDDQVKQVYLVRHAESEANVGGEYKGEHTLLSDEGKAQARQVAERFKKIPFDIVLTSQFTRAVETGKMIAEASGKQAEPAVALFGERQHPPEAIGLNTSSPEYKKISAETWTRFELGDESHPGEETFPMLTERAKKAVLYIEERTEKNIVIVSHTRFIQFLVLYMGWKEKLTPQTFLQFMKFAKISNTGITHLQLKDGEWTLHQWNDKAHLG